MGNVVSLPVSDNVFLASNYDDIRMSISEITDMSCQAGILSVRWTAAKGLCAIALALICIMNIK